MAVMNPCCCRLQLGVKFIAIISIILCVMAVILEFVNVLALLGGTADTATDRNKNVAGDGLVSAVIDLVVYIAELIASVYLLIGAKTRNLYKCRIWFACCLILTGIYLLSQVVIFAEEISGSAQRTEREEEETDGGIGENIIEIIVVILVTGYELWVVYAFMDELKQEAALGRPRGVESGGVYYAPKNNTTGDTPPLYGQAS